MGIVITRLEKRVYLAIGLGFVLFVSVTLFLSPHVISIDSIYGFLAYKGTIQTGNFNVLQEVSQDDVAMIQNHFVSWWSPGQWMAPGIFNFLFGIKLGIACMLATILSVVSGVFGFYKLFRYFGFSGHVSVVSLLFLVLSDTFYTSFIIYQGGEILSFAIFPWFVLFVAKQDKSSLKMLLSFLALFILCFISKTTLVVYCSILSFYKICECLFPERSGFERIKINYSLAFGLAVIWIVSCICIYAFYLQKGLRITFFSRFNPGLSDIFIPIASPLASILSGQTIIVRIQKALGEVGFQSIPIAIGGYLIMGFITVACLVILWKRHRDIRLQYLNIIIVLYVGIALFFIIGYLFDANIDKNVRHFKLLGFMFVPAFVSVVRNLYVRRGLLFLFLIYSVTDFVYLKKKWTEHRYIGGNYFYRNYDNLEKLDGINEPTYRKLIQLDESIPLQIQNRPVVFFFDGNADIAIEMKHLTVFNTEGAVLGSKTYNGNGAVAFVAVSKKALIANPGFLGKMLPEYKKFYKIDETDTHVFFKSE